MLWLLFVCAVALCFASLCSCNAASLNSPPSKSPPNTPPGVFNLVNPLPSKEFEAYGVTHRLRVTGLRVTSDGGVAGRKTWWNDRGPWREEEGYGAALVPMDGKQYTVDVMGELALV